MLEAFVLNPPRRRRAKRSRGRGRRRNARGWFKTRRPGSRKRKVGKGRRRRTVYTHPTKKTRARRRRRNDRSEAAYGINPRRRRRRRRNPDTSAQYGINPHRGRSAWGRKRGRGRALGRRRRNHRWQNPGVLGMRIPTVVGVPLPAALRKGILGNLVHNVIQGSLAGGVVFGGYFGSGFIVDSVEPMLPDALKGRWTRPVLFGAVAGIMGMGAAMVVKGKRKGLWALLAASGSGIRAFGSIVKNVMERPAGDLMGKAYDSVVGMADYIQVGDDLYEAGLEGDGGNTGMGDYIQVGEEAYEAGLGEDADAEEAEEEVIIS
jgi:hypothetical protein